MDILDGRVATSEAAYTAPETSPLKTLAEMTVDCTVREALRSTREISLPAEASAYAWI